VPASMEVRVKLTSLAICAAMLVPNAVAQAVPAAPARGGLTPEERVLYVQEQHGLKWRDLSSAQRCERIRAMRQAREAMTPADRQKLRQRMDAEWKALPAAEQQRIERRIAARRERTAHDGGARRSRRVSPCAGADGGSNPLTHDRKIR
jgi:hypothetical protein